MPLLIDTGADVTLLPLGAVNAAGIEQTGASYELLAFDGRSIRPAPSALSGFC